MSIRMDHAANASDSGPPPVTSAHGSTSPHGENGQLPARSDKTSIEDAVIPDVLQETTEGANPRPGPRSQAPVNLSDALERQAQQDNTMGLPNGAINNDGVEGFGSQSAHSLFDNPPNLSRVRQLLFECKDPIEMSLQEFETYWPFVDNVWVKQRSHTTKEGNSTTEYYMCRLRRPTHRPRGEPKPAAEGRRPRKKPVRQGGVCNVQIKVIKSEGAFSTVTISKTRGSSSNHTHDLDHIDNIKRNSAIMEFIWKEAIKGYLPSSIFAKFQEEPVNLHHAGGRFMTITDVRNVAAKWRIQNPEVTLIAHEGYTLRKGAGIFRPSNISGTHDNSQNPTPPLSMPKLPPDTLSFPQFSLEFLEPYLPQRLGQSQLTPGRASMGRPPKGKVFPHITLSYASSMDSKVSLTAGMQTVLSGPEAKLMTHYLRSRHDAILIGVGTALADNPGLNCRLEGAGGFGGLGRMWQPRPVVIDPTARWAIQPDCRMLRTAVEGKGKAPWIVVSPGAEIDPQRLLMLKSYGGDYLRISEYHHQWRLRWEVILRALASEGIESVMIEGGGTVLSELLNPEYSNFIDSIIATVAPTYLGRGGVSVSPDSKVDADGNPNAALNPREVKWTPLGQNVIMCGKIRPEVAPSVHGLAPIEGSEQ